MNTTPLIVDGPAVKAAKRGIQKAVEPSRPFVSERVLRQLAKAEVADWLMAQDVGTSAVAIRHTMERLLLWIHEVY